MPGMDTPGDRGSLEMEKQALINQVAMLESELGALKQRLEQIEGEADPSKS